MSILEINHLSHTFLEKPLYQNASLSLLKGEHMGIVGQNGVGKSTLLKIITGEIIPDQGEIKWQPKIRIGELNQQASVDRSLTILEYLHTAYQSLYDIEQKMLSLYEKAENNHEALIEAAECQDILEHQGFYEIESKIANLANGLGLTALGLQTPLEYLSGGQRAKVILAKLLLEEDDVLILDEPTNFLDKEHVEWLSGYLKNFPGAFLIVSHQFDFLEEITNSICDLEFQSLKKYHGSYQKFLFQKERLREDYQRQYTAQQKQIEKTEAYIRKNKAGVNSKMARGRQKQLDRVIRLAPPNIAVQPRIRFSSLPLSASKALTVEKLVIGYETPLLPQLSFSLSGNQKIVITGFNGVGKSTLLKTLIGELPALSGSFSFSEKASLGYFAQESEWPDKRLTPLQIMAEAYPRLSEKEIRKKLAQCNLKTEQITQEITTLSGGEQSKVRLCKLLLEKVNFLILDEPTNHLDQETKMALQEALIQFEGCVILVSHEDTFYRNWADQIITIGKDR